MADGIEVLCHISEIEERRPKGDKRKPWRRAQARAGGLLDPGANTNQDVKISADQHKIGLSFRARKNRRNAATWRIYQRTKSPQKSYDR